MSIQFIIERYRFIQSATLKLSKEKFLYRARKGVYKKMFYRVSKISRCNNE